MKHGIFSQVGLALRAGRGAQVTARPTIIALIFLSSIFLSTAATPLPPLPPDPIHGDRTENSLCREYRRVARERALREKEEQEYQRVLFAKLSEINEQQKRERAARAAFVKRKAWLAAPRHK